MIVALPPLTDTVLLRRAHRIAVGSFIPLFSHASMARNRYLTNGLCKLAKSSV
jgi:hypothetical protein